MKTTMLLVRRTSIGRIKIQPSFFFSISLFQIRWIYIWLVFLFLNNSGIISIRGFLGHLLLTSFNWGLNFSHLDLVMIPSPLTWIQLEKSLMHRCLWICGEWSWICFYHSFWFIICLCRIAQFVVKWENCT